MSTIEDMALVARWRESPRLIFRATSRIVKILTDSYYEDVYVRDIYMPEGIDVMQIIPEQDDPTCKHSLMFFLPTEQWPNYYLLTSDGTQKARLRISPNQRVSDLTDVETTGDMVDPTYLSLIAAIGFIADSDEYGLTRHLVLKRDEEKYRHAVHSGDSDLQKQIESRAIRNHKNERIIDTFSLELGEVEAEPTNTSAAGSGNSKRPHVRRGHFRKVRHGPSSSLVKVKWFPPIVVRRDLLSDESEKLLRPNG